jgi:hypothetical protein
MWANFRIVFKKRLRIAIIFILPALISCSGNSFKTFGDVTSDSALYYQAILAINDGDFDEAIDACSNMSSGYADNREVLFLCASAYAGRCGFDMLGHITFLTDYFAAPTVNLFDYYLQQFLGTSAQDVTDCQTAETLMRNIGEASARNDNENAFMILLSLFKIGIYINETADATDNAVVDAAFDTCSTGSITNNQIVEMAGAFWELKQSSAATSISGLSDVNTAVTTICTALDTKGASYDFCDLTAFPTTLNMTAGYLKGMRAVVGDSSSIGIDSCSSPGSGTSILACCP